MKNKHLNSEYFTKLYSPYEALHFGITLVSPKDIIAFSEYPKDFKSDTRMKNLKSFIKANGWDDYDPFSLDLLRLPDSTYIVNKGGNHRAYLSKKLKISQIEANVSILIPCKEIPSNTKSELDTLKDKIDNVLLELNLISKRDFFKKDIEQKEKLISEYNMEADKYNKVRYVILHNLANELGYLEDKKIV